MNKLHKKDFSIAFKTGTDANKSKFKKEAVQGEMYFATDSKNLYVAETTAGLSDATLSQFIGSLPLEIPNDYAVVFDGTNDFVNIGTDTSLDVAGSDFSVALWFRHSTTSQSTTDGMLTIGSFTNKIYLGLGLSNAGVDKVSFGYGTGTPGWYYNAGSGLNDSEWHFLVATVSSGTVTIYVDATSESYSTGSAGVGAYNYFGRGTYGYFGGLIDNAALFNSVLSSSDVSSIYSAGRQGDLSSYSPVGWWKMGESDSGTGTSLTDDSTNSNTGTLSNGAVFANASNIASSSYAIPANETYREAAFDGSIFDGTATGSWYAHTGSFNTTGWVGQDFGSGVTKTINAYRIITSYGTSGGYYPKDWTIDGSNDGTNWTTLDSRTGETSWTTPTTSNYGSAWNEYTFTNNTAYRYYRINVTANGGHSTYLIFSELEFFEI